MAIEIRSGKYQVLSPLKDEDYKRLKSDIAAIGKVREPIDVDENGDILDGHNRWAIIQELGITDYGVTVWPNLSEEEKYEHAITSNLCRRNLTEDEMKKAVQRVVEAHPEFSFRRIADMFGISAPTVSKWSTENNFTVDHPVHEGADGRNRPATAEYAEENRQAAKQEIMEHPEKSDRQIAGELGMSHVTVGKQRKILSVSNPSNRDFQAMQDKDIVQRMAETGSNVAGAIREQKRDQLVQHLESVETQEAKAVEGVYDVIVIDPPWPMEKIERDVTPEQVAFDYPTMSIGEIMDMDIPAADDCHIFLWTTQKFLFDAKDILDAWGFKYICTFVWHKPGGFQPFGLPMYNCEFCLYAHNGAPKFIDQKSFYTCFEAPTRGHSVKPEEFYDMIRRVTAGRRLDMFNRRAIDGFDVWGKESGNVSL